MARLARHKETSQGSLRHVMEPMATHSQRGAMQCAITVTLTHVGRAFSRQAQTSAEDTTAQTNEAARSLARQWMDPSELSWTNVSTLFVLDGSTVSRKQRTPRRSSIRPSDRYYTPPLRALALDPRDYSLNQCLALWPLPSLLLQRGAPTDLDENERQASAFALHPAARTLLRR
jgi:hypothetical protein